MPKKQRKFADDGWVVWVEGDDVSTVYINDWLNPKGKSCVDFAVRVRGIKACKSLNVYMPFAISADEIEDVSLLFDDVNILRATFSSACIVDYKKNEHTSEIAYNGKIVDIVHISTPDLHKEVFEMLGLKESKGYTYLDKTMATGKPFAVIRIDKLYRIPKESFDTWMKQINQPIQN